MRYSYLISYFYILVYEISVVVTAINIGCSCPMYPGEEVTLQERSLRKRSHQHVSLTRIISGWWCDITIYCVCVSLWFSRAISCEHTTHAHTREHEGEFLRLSPWEETLARLRHWYILSRAPPISVRWIRDPPVYEYIRVRTWMGYAWMSGNPFHLNA